MLVLTRKTYEEIHIGDDIVIKVVHAGRGNVKIGVDAPGNFRVLRGELSAELQNLEAGESLTASRARRNAAPSTPVAEPTRVGAV
ncbi:MAG: carbon storage regulator [Maioricimonas sp. JB049]